jgi:transposase
MSMDVTSAAGLEAVSLDHLGIVSAVAHELDLVKKVDARLPRYDVRRKVSNGQCTLAMILNGLGFSNHRLYLVPEFLQNKPVDRLIAPNMKPDYFDDHVLGRTLDEIADYGASRFFMEIALEIGIEQNLLGDLAHIDTSTFSLEGSYKSLPNDEPQQISVCHGYSKDQRADLKQVVLNLATTGPAELPIFMNPLSGNASDKKELHDGIAIVREFKSQLSQGFANFTWVADSALYSKDRLLADNCYSWITRVPETIKEAKALVSKSDSEITWIEMADGYRISSYNSTYGGVEQTWILVSSQQAFEIERKTFHEKMDKQESKLLQEAWHFSNQVFNCEIDARKALDKLIKAYPYHVIGKTELVTIEKYKGRGRPSADAQKTVLGVSLKAEIMRNVEAIEVETRRKGRFIIATNQTLGLDPAEIVRSYKDQQSVERGFRFLKDPWFMADRLFLKSPKRIEALMAIMTLCLMIYNIAQFKLRGELMRRNETLPNQRKRQTTAPTLRWVFQMMEGVIVLRQSQAVCAETCVLNLSEVRQKIISLFGETAQKIYGTS